jgi:hypothetical protein
MLFHYSIYKVFTSHFESSQDDCSQLATHELPAAVSHRELLVNELQSLSFKPLIWQAENAPSNAASNVASLLKPVTSLLTRSGDPFPLLRHPSVHSCCLATKEARQCEAMRQSSRHGRARIGSARRKHRFVYCCVIAGTCFHVAILAWRIYITILCRWNSCFQGLRATLLDGGIFCDGK